MYHSRGESDVVDQPLIPPVIRPKGLAFWLGSWTGLIILLNTLVFAWTLWQSRGAGLLAVDVNILRDLGAKDVVLLSKGQYWRFFTPIFIHGNLLHYAFNNWALFVVGYQIEQLLKPKRFIFLYIISGIGGNIASTMFSISTSVGASGALFGLLGVGYSIERQIRKRLEQLTGTLVNRGVYSSMVVINILFGFVVPMIDNAAHLGGLFSGMGFTFVFLRLYPNRLVPMQRTKAILSGILILAIFIIGAFLGSYQPLVSHRLHRAVNQTDDPVLKLRLLNELVSLDPSSDENRLHRLSLLIRLRSFALATDDLDFLLRDPAYRERLYALRDELLLEGLFESAKWLEDGLQGNLGPF